MNVPVLRIDVEGVQHSIIHALGTANQDFTDIVAEELQKFDIEQMIRERVRWRTPALISDAVDKVVEEVGREIEARVRADMSEVVREAFTRTYQRATE